MKFSDIGSLRLGSQQLVETAFQTAQAMVSWFAAVQGQEYAQTKWGLGLRLPQLGDADIEKELDDGHILRTHLLRPTWHFVASEDIHWLLKLTAPRVNAANAYMYRKLELDASIFNRCNDILIDTLQGGNHLTRDDLNTQFNRHNIEAKGHRLSYIMMAAELAGIICSGRRQGNQFTYALLDERIQPRPALDKDEALARLTRRYFESRGPATVHDFSTWSGLGLGECKKGIAMVRDHLQQETIGDDAYCFTGNPIPQRREHQPIHLLPIYDEFIMGYKDRSPIFEFKSQLKESAGLRHDCMIVSGGQVIGTWKRLAKPKSLQLEYEFFSPLDPHQSKAFDAAVNRLQAFTQLAIQHG
ncbi:MAG TPA: winged helix DNA-binding domain-containing protein [Bacteroidia bacterium]|nr:winged helix DNA-binding domain-containing protein [Bacteroidia bacterium]